MEPSQSDLETTAIRKMYPDAELKSVVIDYTNYQGERRERTVIPIAILWGSNPWHPELQWLLHALDRDKGEERTFAMLGIHSWRDLKSMLCVHGIREGDWCAPCNTEYKRARREYELDDEVVP